MSTSGPMHGFTLIEVVVAVAVIAIGLAATIKTVASVTYNSAELNERVIATWVAQNVLARHELASANGDQQAMQGIETFANTDWQWEKTIHATDDENIKRVDIIVKKQIAKSSHSYAQISTFSSDFSGRFE